MAKQETIKKTTLRWVRKSSRRNWLELPDDVTALILSRVGVIEILTIIQRVCMTWRNICKDPLMWRIIDMSCSSDFRYNRDELEKLCRQAIDDSCGNLVDITVAYFATDGLLNFI